MSTDTTHGARDHARAQAGAVADAMPRVPAPAGLTWSETVAFGGYTSKVLSRGTTVRLASAGGACAHVLVFNADQPWERLNVADTVKIPWQAYLGVGHPLLSDQGRVLATVVADESGGHDALCGATRELFIVAAAKHGLEPRDIPPSVSFFGGVKVEADGSLLFTGARPGAVELRAELPLIVLLANDAHPLDPDPVGGLLEVSAWRGSATGPDDPLWSSTPELERAFANTVDYWEARG
ncbi:MAG: uncharacterized protein QOF76_5073 [Solirubrobacteraceae bacterium]|nr:uncharacterized protein [Solirubrobacteraceae bacterium]